MMKRLVSIMAAMVMILAVATPRAMCMDAMGLWTGNTTLRGANVWLSRPYGGILSHADSGPVGPAYSQQDFNKLAALGCNWVNVSHPGIYTESAPFALDEAVAANLDGLLDMIHRADMFATISFRTGPGRNEFTFQRDALSEPDPWFTASDLDESVWTDQAKQDAWADMWQEAAKRYKDHPAVVGYDLMVEPNSNEIAQSANADYSEPDEFYSEQNGTLYDWNRMYPSLVEAIRKEDTATPVLVGAMNYSAVPWLSVLDKSNDTKAVYMFHQYEPYNYTHQQSAGSINYPGIMDLDWDGQDETVDKAWLASYIGGAKDFADKNGPVAVNEFGGIRWVRDMEAFITDELDIFEQNGFNHAIWMWFPENYAQWLDEFDFTRGPDQNNHAPVASSALYDAIKANWAKNMIRPSNYARELDPRTGWWWPGVHLSGTGMAVEVDSGKLFMAWFTYDESGSATWYVSLAESSDNATFSGDLLSYTGPATPCGQAQSRVAGSLKMTFHDTTNATMNWTIDGHSGTIALSPFMDHHAPGTQDSGQVNGWWWDPACPGTGLFTQAQGDTLFAAWFRYSDDGDADWQTMGGAQGGFPAGSSSLSDTLLSWTGGQAPGAYYSAPASHDTGQASLSFDRNGSVQVNHGLQQFEMVRFPVSSISK